MSEAQQEIAVRLGTAFSLVANRFLPAVTEAVARSAKKITFGATVKCQLDESGMVTVELVPHEPKIPTEPMDSIHFVLRRDPAGQLSFVFDGSLSQMQNAAEAMLEVPDDEDYQPGDNVGLE